MKRRLLGLTVLVVTCFSLAAGAVAYFIDSEETYDVVKAGPPIPWLKVWSQSTDPVNAVPNTLRYATQNRSNPAVPAATGKHENAVETTAASLGRRSAGSSSDAWKKDTDVNVHGRFNRLFTVEVPADVPVNPGETVSLSLSQESSPVGGDNLMFASIEFATITANANTENQAAFRGGALGANVQLSPGDKRQVNVAMNPFGQTDSQSNRIVNSALNILLTTPGGDTRTYRVPISACNHISQPC